MPPTASELSGERRKGGKERGEEEDKKEKGEQENKMEAQHILEIPFGSERPSHPLWERSHQLPHGTAREGTRRGPGSQGKRVVGTSHRLHSMMSQEHTGRSNS